MRRLKSNYSGHKQDSEENRMTAFNFALKYLSIRQRSFKEVYDYLLKKGFDEDTINSALKKLSDLKFLNDQDFATNWIESRQKHKGKSKYILKNELRQKGIADSTIEETLKSALDDLETARIAFEKRKRTLGNLSKIEFKKKMGSFLQRRGYSWEIVRKLLE